MTHRWICLTAICGALAFAGGCNCGNPQPNVNPNGDAGSDAGSGDDAGGGDDAGTVDGGADAGMETDGGEVTDGGSTTDGGVNLDTICADVAKKKCDFFIRCTTATDPEARFNDNPLNQGRANDQVTAAMRAECEAFETDMACRGLVASLENGRSTLDAAKYAACIDAAFPSDTCARDFNLIASSCLNNAFLTANTGNGSLCTQDLECTNGYCAKTGNNICGTCTAYVAIGQKCPRGVECDPSTSYCAPALNPNNRTCTAYRSTGQSCQRDIECGPGNVCQTSDGNVFNRTCAPGVPLGGACTGGHFECLREPIDFDLFNAGGVVPTALCSAQSGPGTCIPIQSPIGGVCGTGEAFNALTSNRGPLCNETGACLSGVCGPRRAAGLPCTSDELCAPGTRCVMGTCTAYKDLGEPCSGNNDCKNFMTCQGATCQPVLSMLGEPCNNTQPCAEGYCDKNTSTCTALKADGEACGADGECTSQLCMGGTCTAACWQ
ncbi:MAG: hypothetical protein IRZ16_22550 [Myxococcaceae bacterium]|nr:hypothetical protein [Myxococcaceae bacterium]